MSCNSCLYFHIRINLSLNAHLDSFMSHGKNNSSFNVPAASGQISL